LEQFSTFLRTFSFDSKAFWKAFDRSSGPFYLKLPARMRLPLWEKFFEKSPELFSRAAGAGWVMERNAYDSAGPPLAADTRKSL
jgi:hypothetical protein